MPCASDASGARDPVPSVHLRTRPVPTSALLADPEPREVIPAISTDGAGQSSRTQVYGPPSRFDQSGCIRRRHVGPLKLKNSRRSMTSTMETIHTFLHESTTPVSQPCHMTAPLLALGNRCSGGRYNGRVVSRPYRQKGTRQGFSLFDHHRVEPSAKFNKRTSPHPFNPDTALQHPHVPSAS